MTTLALKLKIVIKKTLVFLISKTMPGVAHALAKKKKKGSDAELMRCALSFSRDPVLAANYMLLNISSPERDLWGAITSLDERRDPAYDFIIKNRVLIDNAELRFKCDIKQLLSKSENIPLEIFCSLVEEYERLNTTKVGRKQLAGMLVDLCTSKLEVCDVLNALQRLGVGRDSLKESQKVKLLSRFTWGGNIELFKALYSCFYPALSELGKLKIDLVHSSLIYENGKPASYYEKRFVDLPYQISAHYLSNIAPLFKEIDASNDYRDIRFEKDRLRELRCYILDFIVKGKPCAYIRLGDGECYGFVDNNYVDSQGVARQELHWWGELLTPAHREQLRSEFLSALCSANILGVPTVFRLIKDSKLHYPDDYPVNGLISRLCCVMSGAAPFLSDKKIVEDQSNLFLFNADFLVGLFDAAERICVISGLKSELVTQWAPEPKKLKCIEIPTHRLLRNEHAGAISETILPYVYKEYVNEIKSIAGPGMVFLVSAGFIGKIFVSAAAERGAVALDVGQYLVTAVR
ncbi:hypothetical protein D7241_04025 [Stutzerimonas sp. VN223-3]|uniref:hypothetical protein n=1 Tax=Stutzerimonas sp. VN223-3 TaxID=3384601 RepID=UPI0038B656C4